MNWAGTLTNDPNWISGCFEWYGKDTPPHPYYDFQPQGSSKNIYWNDKDSNPNQGEIGGHKVCTRDESATVTSGLTYWDPSDSSERMQLWGEWNAKCGDSFWATSFDWGAIAAPSAVTVCTGSMCAASSIKAACDYDTCSDPSAGCNFDFNMYATVLTSSSQVRVANIFEGLGMGAPLEQVGEAKRQLGYMVDSLNAYKIALSQITLADDTYSASGLIDTQIATINWTSNALNVRVQGILQGNSSGFVPSFNLDFYGQQLGLYFEQFNSLIQGMKEKAALSDINKLIKEKWAIDASVEESTTMVSMGQTIDTIESAASGMSYALQAMKRLNATIVQAGFDFQDALDEYYAQKRREAIWNLAFGVANLCTGGVRTFANIFEYDAKDKESKSKSGADSVSSVGFFTETVANNAKTMGFAASALVSANSDKDANDKFPSDDSVELTYDLMDVLADNDVLLPSTGCDSPADCDIPDGDEMDALQAALDNLNEAYNSLYSPQGPIIASSLNPSATAAVGAADDGLGLLDGVLRNDEGGVQRVPVRLIRYCVNWPNNLGRP